jgi:hypothetical protein
MENTVNMRAIFNAMDTRKAKAEAIIATFTPEQVAEASRIASIYDRCDVTSLKHKEAIVYILSTTKGE